MGGRGVARYIGIGHDIAHVEHESLKLRQNGRIYTYHGCTCPFSSQLPPIHFYGRDVFKDRGEEELEMHDGVRLDNTNFMLAADTFAALEFARLRKCTRCSLNSFLARLASCEKILFNGVRVRMQKKFLRTARSYKNYGLGYK